MTGFHATPDVLRASLAALDDAAGTLGTALGAARTVSLPTEAYGILCAFLPPLVDPAELGGTSTISTGIDGVDATTDAVRAAAGGYDAADATGAGDFRGLPR